MHYKQLIKPCVASLSAFLQKWWHYTKLQQLERAQTRVISEIKHQRIQRLTDEAQQAYACHDSFRLYHMISKHCPKLRTKRIHLKGDDGNFLSPMQETAACVHHIVTNWEGPPLSFPSLPTRCSLRDS